VWSKTLSCVACFSDKDRGTPFRNESEGIVSAFGEFEYVNNIVKTDKTLSYDLHPLYASILRDGATIRQGEVLGLDGDLRRVLVAPFDGVIRLLITGTGTERRVKVFLTPREARRDNFAAGRR
jgi:hypothetical protein